MRPAWGLAAALAAAACAAPRPAPAAPAVLTGLDVLEAQGFAPLKGKRVGVITNRTGIDARGRSIVDLLAEAPGVDLVVAFAPEHGLTGAVERGLRIASATVHAGGRDIPVDSFFGGNTAKMRPRPDQLRGLDALVFDMQDVGARFYTYATTMAMALEETKKAGVEFIVLDRPNPIGGVDVQGPTPDVPGLTYKSSVSYLPVPTRHGLTMGELARLHNDFVRHPRLTVVPMRGWRRAMWFDETGLPWVAPSPNIPDLAAATLYPGLGNFDESNVSVGRGTPHPFGWIGAPWLNAEALARRLNAAGLAGVRVSVQDETPTKSVYEGKLCHGIRIEVTDRRAVRPLTVFAHVVAGLRDLHPKEFDLKWADPKRMGDMRTLLGLSAFQTLYDSGATAEALAAAVDPSPEEFAARRRPFLLYAE
jgi:uncharacterized protein YbbC (DUF1343 family)